VVSEGEVEEGSGVLVEVLLGVEVLQEVGNLWQKIFTHTRSKIFGKHGFL
jgi:hypothetical protein